MVGVVHRADRVAKCVNSAKPLLETGRAHRSRRHHIRARLDVAAVLIGAGQVVDHQLHPFKGDALRHGVIMRAAEGFDTMGKGIKAGARRDCRRHANGQFWIADHHRRQNLGVKDDLLFGGFGVGDDAGAAHLGSGARGGGHGDDGRDCVCIGAGPPIADILKIPNRTGLTRHKGDHLTKVQAGPAAKGDHAIMAACLIGRDACGQVCLVRVGVNLAEHGTSKARCLHHVQGVFGHG